MPASLKLSAACLVLATFIGCSEPDPAPSPPKEIRPVTATTQTGTVGQPVNGGVTVQIVDYSDRAMEGVKVGFSIIAGDGSLSSLLVVTDGEGLAHVNWTLGQTAGSNELVVSIFGLDPSQWKHFEAMAEPAAAVGLDVTPRVVRIQSSATGGSVAARPVDQYGNTRTGTPTYVSRNPAIVTVNSSGVITATEPNPNNRTGSTYIVATVGGFTDSAKVYTLSPTDPACTGITAMAPLNVGDVQVTGFIDNGICVPASAGEREYALVPFFDSPVPAAQTVFTVSAVNVKGTQFTSLGGQSVRALIPVAGDEVVAEANRAALDRRLRIAERREMTARAPGARQWFRSRGASNRANRAATVPNVGDQLEINVNPDSFCTYPLMRTGRVAAVTNKAVVVADVANPPGFSDAEYASLGATFDTLVFATNVTNFGAPTDIDGNGDRVVIFFTHAVNEEGQGILGYAYARDLLPKSGELGSCPGSNVAEMLYIYVPDPSNPIAEVKVNAVATIAHEFQHIINSARRLYINTNGAPAEERWLNEGLSHIAEELVFYRSSTLSPRQNIGSQVSLAAYQTAYFNFQRQNFIRYFRFMRNPGTQGPIGINDDDDDVETRGAIWSFLRYAADQRSNGNEPAFWQSIENSSSIGLQNLYDHVGADTRLLMRDWAISNFIDDLIPTDAKYTQPSWNLRQLPGFQPPVVMNLLPTGQTTPTSASTSVTLRALSSEFIRFGVSTNQEAYISATGFPATDNTPLPRRVLLAIVRTK